MGSEHEGASTAAAGEAERGGRGDHAGEQADADRKPYLRFGAMVLTSMVLMYWAMAREW